MVRRDHTTSRVSTVVDTGAFNAVEGRYTHSRAERGKSLWDEPQPPVIPVAEQCRALSVSCTCRLSRLHTFIRRVFCSFSPGRNQKTNHHILYILLNQRTPIGVDEHYFQDSGHIDNRTTTNNNLEVELGNHTRRKTNTAP